ncbi:MAG: histidine phosphatase family protein [Pseudomonadota bacterium]
MDSQAPRGPIIISRHGRPALDRTAGPRLGWQQYVDWWSRYEAGGLADGQDAPEALKAVVADADLVLSSERLRAKETAARAAPGHQVTHDALFNEAPLPPPRLKRAKYLPKTWNVLARAAWLNGHALDGESVSQARIRAAKAAERLHEAADAGKVYLAAHGWFNRMIRPELRKIGWRCSHDGGDKYWSYRIYEWRS